MKVQELIDTLRDPDDTSITYLKLKEVCPGVTRAELNSIMDALRENSSVRAMNAQNHLHATADTLTRVIAVLERGYIFAINLGEWPNLTYDDWQRLLDALPQTNVGFMYISEPGTCSLTEEQKGQFITVLRANRAKFTGWYTDYDLKEIARRVTNTWFKPQASRYLNDTVTVAQSESGGRVTVVVPPLYRWYGWYELLCGTTLNDISMKAVMACLVKRNPCIAASLPDELSAVLLDSELTKERPNGVDYDIDVDAIDSKLPDVFDSVFMGDTCYVTMVVRRNRVVSESFQPDHVRARKATRPHDALSWMAHRAMRTRDFLTGTVGKRTRLSDEAVMGALEHRATSASWAKRVQMWGLVCAAYELSLRAPFEVGIGRFAYFMHMEDLRVVPETRDGENECEALLRDTRARLDAARCRVYDRIDQWGASFNSLQVGQMACTSAAVVTRLYLIGQCKWDTATIEERKQWACKMGTEIGKDVITSWLCRSVTLEAVYKRNSEHKNRSFSFQAYKQPDSKNNEGPCDILVVQSAYPQFYGPVPSGAAYTVAKRKRDEIVRQGKDVEKLFVTLAVMTSGVVNPQECISQTSVYHAFSPGMITCRYDGISQVIRHNAIMLPHELGGVVEDGVAPQVMLQKLRKNTFRHMTWVHVPLATMRADIASVGNAAFISRFNDVSDLVDRLATECAEMGMERFVEADMEVDVEADTEVDVGADMHTGSGTGMGTATGPQPTPFDADDDALSTMGNPGDDDHQGPVAETLRPFRPIKPVKPTDSARTDIDAIQAAPEELTEIYSVTTANADAIDARMNDWLGFDPPEELAQQGFGTDAATHLGGPDDRGIAMLCQSASLLEQSAGDGREGCHFLELGAGDGRVLTRMFLFAISGATRMPRGLLVVEPNWDMRHMIALKLEILLISCMWHGVTTMLTGGGVYGALPTKLSDTPAMRADVSSSVAGSFPLAYVVPTNWSSQTVINYELNFLNHLTPLFLAVAVARDRTKDGDTRDPGPAMNPDGFRVLRALTDVAYTWNQKPSCLYLMASVAEATRQKRFRGNPTSTAASCGDGPLWQQARVLRDVGNVDERFSDAIYNTPKQKIMETLTRDIPAALNVDWNLDSLMLYIEKQAKASRSYRNDAKTLVDHIWATRLQTPACSARRPNDHGLIPYLARVGDDTLYTGFGHIVMENGHIYAGSVIRGKAAGFGVYIAPNVATEIGWFVDGTLHGHGCRRIRFDGTTEEGDFEHGKLHGPNCKRVLVGGVIEEVEFARGEPVQPSTKRKRPGRTRAQGQGRTRAQGQGRTRAQGQATLDASMPQHAARANELHTAAMREDRRHSGRRQRGMEDSAESDDTMEPADSALQSSGRSSACSDSEVNMTRDQTHRRNMRQSVKNAAAEDGPNPRPRPGSKRDNGALHGARTAAADCTPRYTVIDEWPKRGRPGPEVLDLIGWGNFDKCQYRPGTRKSVTWGTGAMGDDEARMALYKTGIERAVKKMLSESCAHGECIHIVDIGAGAVPHLTNQAIEVLQELNCPFELSLVEGHRDSFRKLQGWQIKKKENLPSRLIGVPEVFEIQFCSTCLDTRKEERMRDLAERIRGAKNVLVIHEIFGTKASDEGCVQLFKEFDYQLGQHGIDAMEFAYFPKTAKTYAIPLHIDGDLIEEWMARKMRNTTLGRRPNRIRGFPRQPQTKGDNVLDIDDVVRARSSGQIRLLGGPGLLVEELHFPRPDKFVRNVMSDSRKPNRLVRNFECGCAQRIDTVRSEFPLTGFGMVLEIDGTQFDTLGDCNQHWAPDIVLCPSVKVLQPGKQYEFESAVRYIQRLKCQDQCADVVDIAYSLTVYERDKKKSEFSQVVWCENERTMKNV